MTDEEKIKAIFKKHDSGALTDLLKKMQEQIIPIMKDLSDAGFVTITDKNFGLRIDHQQMIDNEFTGSYSIIIVKLFVLLIGNFVDASNITALFSTVEQHSLRVCAALKKPDDNKEFLMRSGYRGYQIKPEDFT